MLEHHQVTYHDNLHSSGQTISASAQHPNMTHGLDAVCNEVPGRETMGTKLTVYVPSLSEEHTSIAFL
jgi:hypothetical protein